MTWAGWMVLAYCAASAWMATSVWFYVTDDAGSRGHAWRSGLLAAVAMWILPALFLAALAFGAAGGRK